MFCSQEQILLCSYPTRVLQTLYEEGAFGEEELVRGVVDILSAKIPAGEGHGDILFIWVFKLDCVDVDAIRSLLIVVEIFSS